MPPRLLDEHLVLIGGLLHDIGTYRVFKHDGSDGEPLKFSKKRYILHGLKGYEYLLDEGVDESIAQYREIGCCTSFGEWQKDVNAVAIAFRPPGGRSIMAINCGGPSFNLSRDFLLDEVRPQLLDLASRLQGLAQAG